MQQRSFSMVRRLVLFGLLPVATMHLSARVFLNIAIATSPELNALCQISSAYPGDKVWGYGYSDADCARYSSAWSYITNYDVDFSQFAVSHLAGAFGVLVLVFIGAMLYRVFASKALCEDKEEEADGHDLSSKEAEVDTS